MIKVSYILVSLLILSGLYFSEPIVKYGEQIKYKDKVVFSKQTKYQKIVITKWKKWHSLYINGNQQLSSFDEYLYHEPMVHVPMNLTKHANILILGGGDGCLAREVFKYKDVKKVTLVDLDPVMIDLGKQNSILVNLNENALNNPNLTTISKDAFNFLDEGTDKYDIIFVDLPDPNTVDLNKLYTKEFYYLCKKRLTADGVFITQAGSPYYATKAFYCIDKTLKSVGFKTLPLHNQVLTLGEWGWILARNNEITPTELTHIDLSNFKLKWFTNSAIPQITSFGKPLADTTNIQVNTIFSPSLYEYYRKGNWDLY